MLFSPSFGIKFSANFSESEAFYHHSSSPHPPGSKDTYISLISWFEKVCA